jgi:TP901 family phage tail tape measure protein
VADDVNANIRINIETAQAAQQLRLLESTLSDFNRRVVQSNAQAVAAQQQALSMLQSKVGDIGKFSTQIKTVQTSVGSFSKALDKGKLSFGEYFRYGMASTKTFRRGFTKELDMIDAVAEDRVKRLQTRYIALGKATDGMQKTLAIRPDVLPSNLNTSLALAAQRQQIFNQLLRQGSTHLVNWGKNTQWAGRQLMVGFTIPLTIFGGVAAKTFMQLEEQAINFRKVYGDIFTTDQEVEANLEAVRGLSEEFTKYGIAAQDTLALAGIAAQAGQRGNDLLAATTEATRLSVLGQMDQQEAMRTTITLQNAFQLSNEDLTESINFLNVVENQTVLSLQDVAGAIPRVAPVIKGLGGDVKDLSVMLVAMREGGVTAAEGANALKTSLSRLISPTAGAISMSKELGINLNDIVETNQGDILATVMELAEAMKELSGLEQQRLLSEIFGKRQYARVGALFKNITNEASQAQRVLELMDMSSQDLADTTERELGAVSDSIATKFTKAIESLKIAIAPLGAIFLQIATPIIEAVTKVANMFNNLPDVVKTSVTAIIALLAGIAPIFLMGIGLIGNGIGNMLKGFLSVRTAYQKMVAKITGQNTVLTQGYGYVTDAELDAMAAAASLEGTMAGLTDTVLIQETAVRRLADAYSDVAATMSRAAAQNPQGFSPVRRMATGGFVGGSGNEDNQPALLMPGEFVVNKDAAKQYAPLLVAMNQGELPGLARGTDSPIGSRYVPPVEPYLIPQSARPPLEFGHSAGFSPRELASTVSELVTASDSLVGSTKETDIALKELLDSVLGAEKTFVKFEETSDGLWTATEQTSQALSNLTTDMGAASLGQFGGGRITSGTRNEALKQIGVDEPISFADLRVAAQAADTALQEVASGARNMQEPFQYALQGLIDEYNSLTGNLQSQSSYLLDNVQAMVRDQEMTVRKSDAETALATSLERRAQIEADLVRTGAMVNGEIIDELRAKQVVEAHLLSYADAIATAEGVIEQTTQVAKRASMAAGDASGVGSILQPKVEGTRRNIFPGGATRKSVNEKLSQEGIALGQEWGIYVAQGASETLPEGLANAAEEAGAQLQPSTFDGANTGSPPPWSIQLGTWIGEGINQGMETAVQPPKIPGEYMATPLVGGFGSPQSEQISKNLEELGIVAGSSADDIERHSVAVVESTITEEQNSASTKENSISTEDNTAAVEKNTRTQRRGLGSFARMFYAVDGIALAMSFLPGPLGEVGNKAFMVSAAFTALDAILRVEIIKGALTSFSNALKKAAATAAIQSGLVRSGGSVGGAAAAGAAVGAAGTVRRGIGAGRAGAVASRAASIAGIGKFGQALARVTAILKVALPTLGRLVPALLRFVGVLVNGIPLVGQVVSALILIGTTLATFGFAYKNAGDKVRDLGEAAKIAGDELTSLADRFGFTERTSGFENVSTVLGRSEEARSVAQEAQAYVQEDSGMQERARRLSLASDSGAEAALRSFFMDLLASGAPRDVAVGIVEAVANEAGKQDVFVPISTDLQFAFDDEGKIKDMANFIQDGLSPSITNLEQSFANLAQQGFNQAIDQGAVDDAKRWMAAVDPLPDFLKSAIVPQYEMKKAILDTASSLNLLKTSTQTSMNLVSSQFVNGEINLKKFNAGMGAIEQQLASLPNNQGLEIMKQQLIDIYPQSEETVKSITDAGIAFDILSLQAQGVDMGRFIQQMEAAGLSADQIIEKLTLLQSIQAGITAAQSRVAKLEAQIAEEENKPTKQPGDDTGGGGSKDPFAAAEDELRDKQAKITIKEIEIDRTAEDRFRKNLSDRFGAETIAVGEVEIGLDNMEDARYATEMIGEAIEDLERGPIKAVQDEIDVLNDQIKVYQDEIDTINRDIELQEQAIAGIEREYKPILDSLEKQRSAQEDILEGLEDEIDAQVRPIENRIAELEREARIAQEAAKPRLEALDEEEKLLDLQNESLDEQLDQIDKQEDALDKVAKQNDYISRQRKGQIDLARALAEGDIYAAAQAAEQLRQDAAEKATEDQKEAFDQQRSRIEDEKDQIQEKKDALQEERDLIQEQLDAIDEQIDAEEYRKFLIEDSYRLRLQDANDAIKATDREIDRVTELKDARIEPYQKIIDDYAPQLETLNNNIYNLEEDIKDIEDERLTPLQKQVDKLEDQRDLLDDIISDTERSITKDKAHLAERKKFLDQELQILSARRELADLSSGGGGGGGGPVDLQDPEKLAKLRAELATAQKELQDFNNQKAALTGPAIQMDLPWWMGIVGFAMTAWETFYPWFDENVITPIKEAWNTVSGWVQTNVIDPINNAWNTVSENVGAIIQTIGALFVALWQIIDENVIQPLRTKFDEWYNVTVKPRLDAIVAKWEEVRSSFEEKFNAIKTFFTTWWATSIQPKLDIILEVWEKVKSRFEKKFNEIKTFFTTWWDTSIQPKIDAIVNVWEEVRAAFVEKFEAIGDWWEDWKNTTFDEKVEAMKEMLKSLFDADNWKTWFNDAADAVVEAAKTLANRLAKTLGTIELKIPETIAGVPVLGGGSGFKLSIPEPFPGYYAGGAVVGSGSRDSVGARLTPGEFIIRKSMVNKYGQPMMESINQGSFAMPRYDVPESGATAVISPVNNVSNVNAPVYNTYDMKFNIQGANANADEIAHKVMTKIRNIDNASIRGINGY